MITMVQDSTSEIVTAGLNLILTTLSQSISMYVADSSPWVPSNSVGKLDTLNSIVADQKAMIDELGSAIIARQGIVGRAGFPTEFTDLNDLSFDYLVKLAAKKYFPRDLRIIEQAVPQLEGDREAMELGHKVVGATKAHLEMLKSCLST